MTHMSNYILTNFKLLTGEPSHQESAPDAIVIAGQRIVALGQISSIRDEFPVTEGFSEVDLQGLTVSPGFIDLQLNGCGGALLNNDISSTTLDIMHEANLKSGCTTFLPTLITSNDEDIRKAIDVVSDYRKQHPERVPGLHVEGPYLNVARKGIHNPDLIRQPSAAMVDYLCDHAETVSMLTLAPEVCPEGTIEKLSEAGIVVSIGHTNATCAQVKAAEKAGARFATHLHNAMTPLTSREPGVVGAVFDSEILGAGIIADGYHLSWENLRIAHRIMQDRLVLVTDATPAAGADISEFEFGGQTVYYSNGKCTGADGTLGGSALTMIEAVANSVEQGIDVHAAIRMATINPAKAIHLEESLGQIAPGQFANLCIFDDHFKVRGSVSGGALVLS